MAVNLFDANFYRAANSDLRNFSDAQALSHFQNYGLNEGRAFSPFVNLNFYRSSNQDLANLGLSNRQLFDHLQNYGVKEGRSFSPLVDLNYYRTYNSDLKSFNNEQLFEHLRNYGVNDGRSFDAFVNLNIYRVANPDLSTIGLDNKQMLNHLAIYGIAEGRRFSVSFDSNYYRSANSDLESLNNWQLLDHFERYGLTEGRASSESFNISYYLANNSDLKELGFNNQQAQQHFEMYGFREGRGGAASRQSYYPSTDPAIGNTLNAADNLGILTGSLNIKDFVGTTDRNDYYRFTLANTSNFNLSLSNLSSYATVELILDKNGNGNVDSSESINYNSGSSNGIASISSPLGAGTYFIRVYVPSYYSTNTNYTLNVSATAIQPTTPRDPGNTLNTALDIGTLNGNTSFSDFVGSVDRDDYYRFTLTSPRNFNLSLSGLSATTEVDLIQDKNGNGQVDYNDSLDSKYGYSNSDASMGQFLTAGTYFVRVQAYSYSNPNSVYTLSLSA